MRTFASQGLTPQIVISYPVSSHLHHICASSYLRFLSQIFTSSLSSSGLHILRPHLVFTRSDLHRRVTLSLSYHLQNFIMQLLSQLYNLIYLRLQNFISPLSGQPSSSLTRYFTSLTYSLNLLRTSFQNLSASYLAHFEPFEPPLSLMGRKSNETPLIRNFAISDTISSHVRHVF